MTSDMLGMIMAFAIGEQLILMLAYTIFRFFSEMDDGEE